MQQYLTYLLRKPESIEQKYRCDCEPVYLTADVDAHIDGIKAQHAEALAEKDREIHRLSALINNPHTTDFLEAVKLEAAHQRERWGVDHDAGKDDCDWFWLIGFLAGKAMSKPERQLHHIITTAAACLNWHANKTGYSTSMRPGISSPETSP